MKFYATSDFHGHYNLYKKIKEMVDPQDIIYVLGDCADRGPNGWKTLKAVIEDPQCILLMGNHEHMLMKSMEDFFNAPDEYTINDDSRLEYIYAFSENFDYLGGMAENLLCLNGLKNLINIIGTRALNI